MSIRSASIGLEALGANPLRTILSTLGVVIGVAALVAVLALGDGVEAFTREQFANTTSLQSILVTPKTTVTVDGVRIPGSGFPVFTPAEAEAVLREVTGVASVQLRMVGSGRITLRDTGRAAVIIGGFRTPAGGEPELASGRWPGPHEMDARVAVISPGLARALAGDSLILEGRTWSVIGVLAGESDDSTHRVLVPLTVATTAMVASEWPRAPDLMAQATRIEEVETVRARLEEWVVARDPSWKSGFTIATQTARAAQARQGVCCSSC